MSRDDGLSRRLIFGVITMSVIDNRKPLLHLYESGVESANVLYIITSIPKSVKIRRNFEKGRASYHAWVMDASESLTLTTADVPYS